MIDLDKFGSILLKSLIHYLSKRNAIPIRPNMGSSKSRSSIGRKFIDDIIRRNIDQINGDILEIGRNKYKHLILSENINSYACLDIENYSDIDIIADIQDMPQIADNQFDTIICTQVLEHVPNPFLAVSELHRILKPGGKIIVTVPFLNNYHMEPHDYWRFTEYGLSNLFKEFSSCEVESHGATYHHVLATLGYCATEMEFKVEERSGVPKFPVIVSAIAIK